MAEQIGPTLDAVCTKCGNTLRRLMFTALFIDLGGQSSLNPIACKHEFVEPKEEEKK